MGNNLLMLELVMNKETIKMISTKLLYINITKFQWFSNRVRSIFNVHPDMKNKCNFCI